MTLFYADEAAAARELADVVDLFAGPGGWSEGLRLVGHRGDVGLELDRWANATRRAAGHPTVECNVADVDPVDYVGASGLIASPPCQAFSTAGTKHARPLIDELRRAIAAGDWTARPHRDPNVWLALEVGRWAEALNPEWIALEQVPAVLPLWEEYAERFHGDGYATWTGILDAADYGVPQHRKRAVLIASTRPVTEPPPTHRGRWVTMADALGWREPVRVGFPRRDDRGDSPDGYRERDWQTGDEPANTLTEKARSWLILNTGRDWKPGGTRADAQTVDPGEGPAPTFTLKSGAQWHLYPRDEPDARPLMLTVAQALTLQSFPADYPVRGTRSRQFEQIGNAIPPKLAEAILRQVC